MKNLVEWNKIIDGKPIWEWFIELGELDEIDTEIVKYRKDKKKEIKDLNAKSLSRKIHVSEETIHKRTLKLIDKYKKLMRDYPDILLLNKKLTNVECIYAIVDKNKNYYTVEILNENFNNIEELKEYAIKLVEKKYNINVKEMGRFRVISNMSFEYDNTL